MKNSKKLLFMLPLSLLLVSCGGPNLGKEITVDEFVRISNNPSLGIVTYVKGSFKLKVSGTGLKERDIDVNLDFSPLDPNHSEEEIEFLKILNNKTPSEIIGQLTLYGMQYKTYRNEQESTISLKVDTNGTYEGITTIWRGTYVWDNHNFLKYIDEFTTSTNQKAESLVQETFFNCTYTIN